MDNPWRRLLNFLKPAVEAPEAPEQRADGPLEGSDYDVLEGLFAVPQDYEDEDLPDVDRLFAAPQESDDEDFFNLQGLFALEQYGEDVLPPDQAPDPFRLDPYPVLKYLSHISYDHYVKEGGGGHQEVVAHDSGLPLIDFLQLHHPVVRCNQYSIRDDKHVLPGETDFNKNFLIAAETTKKIARSMLKGLRMNESKFSFFSPFDSSNILVSQSGKVTFRGVRLLTPVIQVADKYVPDIMALNRGTRLNIMAVHDIIQDVLFSGNPPKDIQDLLTLMKFDVHRSLHYNHGSLAPIATYSDLFRMLYDFVRHVLPKEDLREILKHMPYVNEWKRAVEENDLLMSTFTFNQNTYSIPTVDLKNPHCLSNEQRKALKALGLTEVRGQTELDSEQIALLNALQFLDFLRNRTSHRVEAYKRWILAQNPLCTVEAAEKIALARFAIEGTERIAFVRFCRVVGYLQVQLGMMGKLKGLPIAKFF